MTSHAEAFEQGLIDEAPKLRRFALKRCGKPEQADDLVQETMARALINRDKFKHGTNIGAWLVTILRNTHLNQIRKSKREQVGMDEEWEASLSAPATQEHHIALIEVDRALNKLSAEHKDVLLTAGLDGESYKAVAERCDCPVGTVRSRLSRARRKLHETLAAKDGTDELALAA